MEAPFSGSIGVGCARKSVRRVAHHVPLPNSPGLLCGACGSLGSHVGLEPPTFKRPRKLCPDSPLRVDSRNFKDSVCPAQAGCAHARAVVHARRHVDDASVRSSTLWPCAAFRGLPRPLCGRARTCHAQLARPQPERSPARAPDCGPPHGQCVWACTMNRSHTL